MSGLAAGIRLAIGGRKVLIVERHNAPGGLNGFFYHHGCQFDVGLHALTNYTPPGAKSAPLVRLLRQLRLRREDLDLAEQYGSKIAFPGAELRFNNDFTFLEQEVADKFPSQADGFRRLVQTIRGYDGYALSAPALSAREVLSQHLSEPVLREMLLCPLMFYGSAWENDMEFWQFAVLFEALFLEGMARPPGGARAFVRLLLDHYRALGGRRRMKCGARRIRTRGCRAQALELDDGSAVTADHYFSTAGLVETLRLCDDQPPDAGADAIGKLSFFETTLALGRPAAEMGWKDTIVFYNSGDRFDYAPAREPVDLRSGVICLPDNYHYAEKKPPSPFLRAAAIADYSYWAGLGAEEYQRAKTQWSARLTEKALEWLLPPVKPETLERAALCQSVLTPRAIERYTGRLGGAVYGSPNKRKDGRTHLRNLYLAGTDQGFLGITGALLSGIAMANHHVLRSG